MARWERWPPTRAAEIRVRRSGQGCRLPRALRGSGTSTTASIRVLEYGWSITHVPWYGEVPVIVNAMDHFFVRTLESPYVFRTSRKRNRRTESRTKLSIYRVGMPNGRF